MKKIILSALLLTSTSLIAQDFNRQDFAYKQFSPYWRIIKTETGTNTMIPFQPLDLFLFRSAFRHSLHFLLT